MKHLQLFGGCGSLHFADYSEHQASSGVWLKLPFSLLSY